MKSKTEELDRLLGKGRLCGPERDRILEEVVRRHATDVVPQKAARFLWLKVAAASALCLLIAVPAAWHLTSRDETGLRTKGSSTAAANVDIGCEGACTQGSTLMFRVSDLDARARLIAYAINPQGKRIWYFPSPNGMTPAVKPTSEPRVLEKGVLIGSEHEPGTYKVHILMSRSRLSRDELKLLSTPARDERILGYWVKRIEVK